MRRFIGMIRRLIRPEWGVVDVCAWVLYGNGNGEEVAGGGGGSACSSASLQLGFLRNPVFPS